MALIVCEGLDGCGKSTQISLLAERLTQQGRQVHCLREPGGTALGEQLRAVLLHPETEADPVAELLAYQTARAQLVRQVIQPALAAGDTVLLDRFWYSTIAYQAYGLGLDEGMVRQAIDVAVGDCSVALGIYCRIDPAVARARRAGQGEDRIEARAADYHQRVYDGYEAMVEWGELCPVDADQDREAIAKDIWNLVASLI